LLPSYILILLLHYLPKSVFEFALSFNLPMNYITFDIETYNIDETITRIDPKNMRVSVIGAYYSWLDQYVAFTEDTVQDFLESLKLCDIVVGFNHLWFDLPVLAKYSSWDFGILRSYDILLEVEKKLGFKVKLDDLAKSNLNIKKTDSYEHFRYYHRDGKWLELIDYCMNDVLITEKLFGLILQGQPLKYADMLQIREVTLDLPKTGSQTSIQVDSLF